MLCFSLGSRLRGNDGGGAVFVCAGVSAGVSVNGVLVGDIRNVACVAWLVGIPRLNWDGSD